MCNSPNIVFLLVDQLRACSLPAYGETQIETPNLTRLQQKGTTFTNMISTSPVCTPYRSMLLTGRHPQSTGHVFNFLDTRHDEIGFGDAFKHAGYRTGYVGKWHLHTGSFPQINGPDFVPEGRDRLGFDFWRAYNFHVNYFNGSVNRDNWEVEHWDGYETDALNRYAMEFIDSVQDDPFCLFVSPHQPHVTNGKFVPDRYLERLPERMTLPGNVTPDQMEDALKCQRDYLAMVLAIDDMVGELYAHLEKKGLIDNTIFIFTSDHGTQLGGHGHPSWNKKLPYEESMHVPFFISWPGHFENGTVNDTLTAPVDLMPTLCSLCRVPIPRTVEGHNLADAWLGKPDAFTQDAVFTMNFTANYDYLTDGGEWRGVRTKTASYARWLDGRVELFDLENDRLQMHNLVDDPAHQDLLQELSDKCDAFMTQRFDTLMPATAYKAWFDPMRRVVRNAAGPLGAPDKGPDWTLLR